MGMNGRMNRISKSNLLVADRVELDHNKTFDCYAVRLFKGDKMSYMHDGDGVMNYSTADKARRAVKRIRPDLEPTTI